MTTEKRVAQQYVEILGTGARNARVAQQYVEILGDTNPTHEISQSALLTQSVVGGKPTPPGYVYSSTAISLTQTGSGRISTIQQSVTQAATLVDAASYIGPKVADATSAIILSDLAHRGLPYTVTASSNITLSSIAIPSGSVYVSATNALTVDGIVDTVIKVRPAYTSFTLTQTATAERSYHASTAISLTQSVHQGNTQVSCNTPVTLYQIVRAGLHYQTTNSAILLIDTARSSIYTPSLTDVLTVDHVVTLLGPKYATVSQPLGQYTAVWNPATSSFINVWSGLDHTAVSTLETTYAITQYLQTTQVVHPGHIRANATEVTANTAVALTDLAALGATVNATSAISLTDSCTGFTSYFGTQAVSLTQVALVNTVRNSLQCTTACVLSHSLGYSTAQDVTGIYHPWLGSNIAGLPTLPSPTSPTYTPTFGITLTGVGSWTTRRSPNFGNKKQLMFQRISRKTRGGRTIIFADANWPKDSTHVMTVSNLTEVETEAYLDFVQDNLGTEISMLDWLGQTLTGIIINPQDPVVRNGPNNNTITIQLKTLSV